MRLQRRLDFGTVAKLFGAALILLLIGLSAGYLLAHRQTLACKGTLQQAKAAAASATSALTAQTTRCKQVAEKRDTSRALVEARARLLQGLIEVHGKNFGLASQHLEAAKQQIESSRGAWPNAEERKRLSQLAERLSNVHERTMLLDARVADQLKSLVTDLQAFVVDEPS